MEKRKTLWTSHRGYCLDVAENTKASFDLAKSVGFVSFETDLRMTKDGHIVLCHDLDFSRLGGPKTPVAQMDRSQIENISLNHGCSPLFFDEFVGHYSGFSWIFDIKAESALDVISFLKSWVIGKEDYFFDSARFLFWDKSHQDLFQSLFPKAHCLARKSECWKAGIASILGLRMASGIEASKAYAVKPKVLGFHLFKKRHVNFYHNQHAKILAYLPASEEDHLLAVKLGFDEILTNGPLIKD